MHGALPPALSDEQIHQFVSDGFIRIDNAFPRALADEACQILWRDTGCGPRDRRTWTRPVVRLGMYEQAPFVAAANTGVLRAAYDQLVGSAGWLPCGSMGTFVVRFPSAEEPADTGWHVDMSFGWNDPDFMNWRVNVDSKGRALLMLFLFSDVGEDDAPTRIRVGSHLDVARLLAPAGDEGMTLRELVEAGFGAAEEREVALATGPTGTVYLCHPFLVHAGQPHRGERPRFLAQPPLLPRGSIRAGSPVHRAIRLALE